MRFGSLGPTELLLILAIIVLLFGASRLGSIGGALGQSIREFRKSARDPEEEARKREEERLKAEEAGRFTATGPAPSGNGTTEVRPAPPVAPTQSSASTRPPDFTGKQG